MTFDQWMQKVDALIQEHAGVPRHYLAAWYYRESFEDGYTPEEVTLDALHNQGMAEETLDQIRDALGVQ